LHNFAKMGGIKFHQWVCAQCPRDIPTKMQWITIKNGRASPFMSIRVKRVIPIAWTLRGRSLIEGVCCQCGFIRPMPTISLASNILTKCIPYCEIEALTEKINWCNSHRLYKSWFVHFLLLTKNKCSKEEETIEFSSMTFPVLRILFKTSVLGIVD